MPDAVSVLSIHSPRLSGPSGTVRYLAAWISRQSKLALQICNGLWVSEWISARFVAQSALIAHRRRCTPQRDGNYTRIGLRLVLYRRQNEITALNLDMSHATENLLAGDTAERLLEILIDWIMSFIYVTVSKCIPILSVLEHFCEWLLVIHFPVSRTVPYRAKIRSKTDTWVPNILVIIYYSIR